MSQPNYEAIGRYYTLRDERQKVLSEIHVDTKILKQAIFMMDCYNPPRSEVKSLIPYIEEISTILPRLKESSQKEEDIRSQMSKLKAEYNIPE